MATPAPQPSDTPHPLSSHPETLAVHAGVFVAPHNAPAAPPLYQAAAYRFRDLDEVEAVYSGEIPGAIYGRYGGPNGAQFAEAVAQLEGAQAAVAASSGMAAIDAALATNLSGGESIVATRDIYGGTYELLEHEYAGGRNRVIYVDTTDLAATENALRNHRPRILYIEALTNPLIRVADIPGLAALAHDYGALCIVDATFASPVLIAPLAYGADIVVHSVTKYIGGHGDVGAGVLAASREFVERAQQYLIRTGSSIPHFEAWLALRGLRTLALRMTKHSANAAHVAEFLSKQTDVLRVHYPTLTTHPQHAIAARLYPRGVGGMLAFDLAGGRSQVDRFLRGLRTIAIVHSLGEVGTTIGYSAVSSHRALPQSLREALGVTEGTLRISTGIEHPDDITSDLAHAFAGLSGSVHA